jgi:hypothetical protein
MKYPEILKTCQTNRQFRDVCSDESLWHQLTNRDYPWAQLNPDLPWRHIYESAYRQIHDFTRGLIDKYLLANPRYARLDVMAEDIMELLNNFLIAHQHSRTTYSHSDTMDLTFKVFKVLSGLKTEYINENRGLDMRVDDIDLEIEGTIENFFNTLLLINFNNLHCLKPYM